MIPILVSSLILVGFVFICMLLADAMRLRRFRSRNRRTP